MSRQLEGYSTVIGAHLYNPRRDAAHQRLAQISTDPMGVKWNEVIARECYTKLLAARTIDAASFDCYATLRTELGIIAPEHAGYLKEAMRARGVGDPYLHVLLPDLSEQDQVILLNAGKVQFEQEAGAAPQFLWVAETALSTSVLKSALKVGYKGILCAPEQIIANQFPDNHPVRVDIPDMGQILLLPFDRPASSRIAFDPKVDADAYAREALSGSILNLTKSLPAIVWTDGETFGHHFHDADQFLDYLVKSALPNLGASVLGINQLPEVWEEQDYLHGTLRERTAWSCPHGELARWHGVCGCQDGYNGAWKEPFYGALLSLNNAVTELLNQHLPPGWDKKLSDNFDECFNYPGSENNLSSLYAAKASSLGAMISCGTFFGSPLTSGKINVLFVRQTLEHIKDAQFKNEADQLLRGFIQQIAHGYDQFSGQTLDQVFADLLAEDLPAGQQLPA